MVFDSNTVCICITPDGIIISRVNGIGTITVTIFIMSSINNIVILRFDTIITTATVDIEVIAPKRDHIRAVAAINTPRIRVLNIDRIFIITTINIVIIIRDIYDHIITITAIDEVIHLINANAVITTATINTKAMRIDIDGIVAAYEVNRTPTSPSPIGGNGRRNGTSVIL